MLLETWWSGLIRRGVFSLQGGVLLDRFHRIPLQNNIMRSLLKSSAVQVIILASQPAMALQVMTS